MAETVRQFYMYFRGRKIGLATKKTLEINSNSEPLLTDKGYVGNTQAPITSKLSADKIVPVGGTSDGMLQALLNQEMVDIGIAQIDGKILQIEMHIDSAKYDTDSTNGTLTGSFEFSGGKPELTG